MYLRDVRFRFMRGILICAVFLLLTAVPAWSAGQLFTLAEALESAHKNNPEIRAFRKNWSASKSRAGLDKSPEKLRLTYESMYSGDEKIIGVSQEFSFPGKLRVKGAAAASESGMAEQDLRAKEREVRSQVKSAYAMYFLTVKSIEIFEENADLMRRFAKVAESKYSVGKANQTDVLRAQIELSKMINMLVTLNQEKETAQAMLVMLMNLPAGQNIGAPQEPEIARLRSLCPNWKPRLLKTGPNLSG